MNQRTIFTGNLETKGNKKLSPTRVALTVRNDGRQSGFTVVNFRFLSEWLGEDTELFLKGIEIFSRRYNSASPVYSVRKVLKHWSELHKIKKWRGLHEIPVEEFEVQLSELRQSFYISETAKGKALTTTTNKWALFVRLVESLAVISAIPKVVVGGYMQAPSKAAILLSRDVAVESTGTIPAPKTYMPERDSYNDELFETISILASDNDYLLEYAKRLSGAIAEIKRCALSDFERLKAKEVDGAKLIKDVGRGFLDRIEASSSRHRYFDPANGFHYFASNSDHPKLLGNILAVVHYQMQGIPKPHRKFDKEGCVSISDHSHWTYIQRYGKNRLLPYLGIMSSEAAAICILILMLEHPALNATSLYRARIEDKNGCSILLSAVGKNHQRLTVQKPRAGEEKSVVLSPLAREVIQKVLDWTAPIRAELKRQNRHEEAKLLWVGMSMLNYDVIAYSEKALFGALKVNPKHRKRGAEISTRIIPFVDRHPSLEKWKDKINFKAIRVNVGVLTYLETDGDLVSVAKAFGHKNVRTTISNYIPRALRQAVFERQIRRHQNLLITSSLSEKKDMLAASDFRTIEELHQFLRESNSYLFGQAADKEYIGKVGDGFESNIIARSKIVFANDPDALAVAMLYRDRLHNAKCDFIDRKDIATGISPRFWMEFVDALLKPLPLSMSEISRLVKKALERKKALSNSVVLPEID